MDLARASAYHAQVCVAGWDQDSKSWVPNVSKGDWRRADIFLSARQFGLVKRLFLCPQSSRIPSDYRVVKFSDDDQRYLVEAENQSRGKLNQVYQYLYQLRVAPYEAEVIELQSEDLSSGLPGNAVPVVVDKAFCGLEPYGNVPSADFDAVVYDKITVVLPGNVPLTTDNLLRINDLEYDVHQVTPNVLETLAICTVRGRG